MLELWCTSINREITIRQNFWKGSRRSREKEIFFLSRMKTFERSIAFWSSHLISVFGVTRTFANSVLYKKRQLQYSLERGNMYTLSHVHLLKSSLMCVYISICSVPYLAPTIFFSGTPEAKLKTEFSRVQPSSAEFGRVRPSTAEFGRVRPSSVKNAVLSSVEFGRVP